MIDVGLGCFNYAPKTKLCSAPGWKYPIFFFFPGRSIQKGGAFRAPTDQGAKCGRKRLSHGKTLTQRADQPLSVEKLRRLADFIVFRRCTIV